MQKGNDNDDIVKVEGIGGGEGGGLRPLKNEALP